MLEFIYTLEKSLKFKAISEISFKAKKLNEAILLQLYALLLWKEKVLGRYYSFDWILEEVADCYDRLTTKDIEAVICKLEELKTIIELIEAECVKTLNLKVDEEILTLVDTVMDLDFLEDIKQKSLIPLIVDDKNILIDIQALYRVNSMVTGLICMRQRL